MSDKTERDPRLDPRPGDVLRKDGERREMVQIGSAADVEEWRKWAAGAEVVKRAEERA